MPVASLPSGTGRSDKEHIGDSHARNKKGQTNQSWDVHLNWQKRSTIRDWPAWSNSYHNTIVDWALRLYQAQLEDLTDFTQAADAMVAVTESLSDAQRFQVKDLFAKLLLRTIDHILEMADEVWDRRFLRRDLGRP